MFRNFARCALTLLPALALAACGSSREEELAKQLAEAKATALEEAAARKQAEHEASKLRTQAQNAALSEFYGNDAPAANGDGPPPDLTEPADPGGQTADDTPPPDPAAPAMDAQPGGA